MVNKPAGFSLADIKAIKPTEVVSGWECSGNSARTFEGLSSCGTFAGVRLNQLLKQVGVGSEALEVVFFGTDRGNQEIVFRQQTYELDQQFARSITLEHAMKPEPLLANALNGEPLRCDNGLSRASSCWAANVKWLSEVHLQDERFPGNVQACWYGTLRGVGGTGEDVDPATQWVENEVTRMHPKSVLYRVRKRARGYRVFGFVLSDVQTVVYRLEEKKAVCRTSKFGNAHVFEAVVSRDSARHRMIDDLVALFDGRRLPIVTHLIESGKLSPEELREARAALRKATKQEKLK